MTGFKEGDANLRFKSEMVDIRHNLEISAGSLESLLCIITYDLVYIDESVTKAEKLAMSDLSLRTSGSEADIWKRR